MAGFSENRLGRQLALQFLFSLDFNDMNWRLALPEFWHMDPLGASRASLDKDEAFAAPQQRFNALQAAGARAFAEPLISGVCEQREELDAIITAALDNWKPERVGRIEWTILRMALYEIIHYPESPDTVVISEAVRLATLFSDAESSKFVNGLLNRYVERARENGKTPCAPDTEPA